VGIIAFELEILELEIEERLDVGIENHLRQGTRLTGEL
jgi:hypothetical protein